MVVAPNTALHRFRNAFCETLQVLLRTKDAVDGIIDDRDEVGPSGRPTKKLVLRYSPLGRAGAESIPAVVFTAKKSANPHTGPA